MTETIQLSLYDELHYAISLTNGRQYELGYGEVIEIYHAGKWQRARLPDGHPGVSWLGGGLGQSPE
ncbi:MAG: hypothetical protein M1434_04330 [Chloroflexi bacterium]|nr:hypothetical protein [Chloroflexota bacterium]MCL5273960.1 hypothetical protein [Chloroflexota bacterium]